MESQIKAVLDAIENLVNYEDQWKDKAKMILDNSVDSSLDEFLSWFEFDEEGDLIVSKS